MTDAGPISYAYNPYGAVTSWARDGQAAQQFTYNDRQWVTAITKGTDTSTFVYDADGNRVARTLNGATTWNYGDWYEDVVTGSFWTSRQIHYQATGELVATRRLDQTATPPTSVTIWYTHDHLSSLSASRTGNGAPTRSRYYPYGTTRTATPTTTDKGYIGEPLDPTGLHHLGARYYDPTLGRFLAVDAIAAPITPQSQNPYPYAANDPINLADPTGLAPRACARYSGR